MLENVVLMDLKVSEDPQEAVEIKVKREKRETLLNLSVFLAPEVKLVNKDLLVRKDTSETMALTVAKVNKAVKDPKEVQDQKVLLVLEEVVLKSKTTASPVLLKETRDNLATPVTMVVMAHLEMMVLMASEDAAAHLEKKVSEAHPAETVAQDLKVNLVMMEVTL